MNIKQLAEICKDALETISKKKLTAKEKEVYEDALSACDYVMNEDFEEYDEEYMEENEKLLVEINESISDIQAQIVSISKCVGENFKNVYNRLENLEAINAAQNIANLPPEKSKPKRRGRKKKEE